MALQFYSAADRTAQGFTFESVTPNARANDLLGEGWCGKKWQESVDRAFFYARANKVGTVVDQNDALCVEGNRKPAWTSASNTYAVKGAWLDKPLLAYKLSLTVYEKQAYLHDWIKARAEKQCEDIVPLGPQPRGSSSVESFAIS